MTAITSGVLAERFTKTPWTILRRDGVGKRRIMEFLQVMRQLLMRENFGLTPKITIGQPISFKDYKNLRDGDSVMRTIVDRAKDLMNQHMALIKKDGEED